MRTLYFCPVSSFFFFSTPNHSSREIGCLPYTWCGSSVNLECRSEMCCTWLAGNAGSKKSPKIRHWAPSHNFVGLHLDNQGTYRQSQKKTVKHQCLPTCPHNMVNFGPLAAEICWRVWGTPAYLNGFRVLVQRYCTAL